jgi:exodeoxyribonuclease V alpha subunit
MLRHSYRTEGKGLLDCANWINQQQIDRQGMGAFKALFANHSNTLCWLVMPEMDSTADRQVSSNRYDWRELEQRVVSGYRGYLQMLSEVDMCEDEQGLQQWARALLNKYRQFQLLVAVRQGEFGVEALNQRVRQWLVNHGLLTNADATWYQGRPVILTRNDYHLGLMNGDIGICVSMPTEQNNAANAYRVVFAKIDNQGNYTGLHWILPSRLQWVESVYAMTVHKSQGSEFEHTALVLPDRHKPTLTKELLYTAITRSKQQFTLVTPSQRVLEDTLSTKVQRVSGLMR